MPTASQDGFPFTEEEQAHTLILDKIKEFLNSDDDNRAKEALTHWVRQNLPEQINSTKH